MKHPLRGLLCVIVASIVTAMVVSVRGQINNADDDRIIAVIPEADRYATGRVFLERADRLLKPAANVEYQVLIGNVIFRRGDMYMYCDSAHFYDATSSLQAFGNVKMEQGDTLFVYADELQYADSTELAILFADPGKKVRLINKNVELKTDVFNYDMGIELGYYEVGGELTDERNRLTSIYGEYAPKTKDALFRNRVHLNSLGEKDTLDIYTEALHYNTDTHIADLTDESTILSKDGTIYTSNGVYNTETTIANLYSRSLVVTKTGKTLTGDTLFYDRNKGYGEAWGNMIINDTINKSKLLGEYGFYNELTDSAFVTGRALAVDYSSADSLSLHGDTIQAFRVIVINKIPIPQENVVETVEILQLPDSLVDVSDTLRVNEIVAPVNEIVAPVNEIVAPVDEIVAPVDTIANQVEVDGLAMFPLEEAPEPEIPMLEVPDTTHYIVAYPNVRFYRTDLQGVCDSMTFVQRDSLLHMDIDPIVWSGERQIFGQTIIVHMNDSTADRVTLPNDGFMAELLEEGFFNQMSGREMIADLANGTIKHLDVKGNVTLVFFPMEEDSTYNKVANAESSFLAADFEDGQIAKLKMWPQSTEVLTPLYMAKKSLFFLAGFRWEAARRPKGHDDLMPVKENDSPSPEVDTPGVAIATENDIVELPADTQEADREVEQKEPTENQ